jgi:hypothetical protein
MPSTELAALNRQSPHAIVEVALPKTQRLRELAKVKYKRDTQGRIVIQGKVEFKKDHGFSPDRFDASIHTFFKDDPTREVIVPKEQMESLELGRFIRQSNEGQSPQSLSSM